MKELDLEQMESVEGGLKMPCSVALALYGFAFVGLCAASGGFAVCAVAAFGASIWDVFDAC